VVDCLVDRTGRALSEVAEVTALVVAGGVAANQSVRAALTALAASHGLPFVAPPLWLCTDNAAMIAWAGALRFEAGWWTVSTLPPGRAGRSIPMLKEREARE
jgi:N6-L-threonylcarbamoyladenine synthase